MKQELIWELMKQAGELAYEEHKAKCLKEGLDPEHTVWSVTGATVEKFTELIVRECAVYCAGHILPTKTAEENDLNYNDGVMDCAIGLKQHFGVEE